MAGERFDAFTRRLAQGSNRQKAAPPDGLLARLFARLSGDRKPPRAPDQYRGKKAGPEERARVASDVRRRRVSDVKEVRINPRGFLARLQSASRAEFFSFLTPEQRARFHSLNTSRDFFALLSDDQRVALALDYVPRFLDDPSWADEDQIFARRPAGPASVTASIYASPAKAPSRQPAPAQPPWPWGLPSTVLNGINMCTRHGVGQTKCYYEYSGYPATDRDGAPCTYGPFPCGSTYPNNDTTQTRLCSGPAAGKYDCESLPFDTPGVASCPHAPHRMGVPLENICNATGNETDPVTHLTCRPSNIDIQRYTSVVTTNDIPGCITDHYMDPTTGRRINVPVYTDRDGHTPCIQQSDAGACGGEDCPCPGLYISQSGFRDPNWGNAKMSPASYLNALTMPYVSVPTVVLNACSLKEGMLVLASTVYDPQSNPTEDPADWVAGVLADAGGTALGEMSYSMRQQLGSPSSSDLVQFRIFPKEILTWPVDTTQLDPLKTKHLGVCCPGDDDNPCHVNERRGECIRDPKDERYGQCACHHDWLPDKDGDCTWQCPGSDDSIWVGSNTDSGYQECDGNGRCVYQRVDANGDRLGICSCDDGWWGGFLAWWEGMQGHSCLSRDCVKLEDWDQTAVPPCYGHGDCHRASASNEIGTCTCYDGWSNGADGTACCSERVCSKNCSDHGACLYDASGNPYCDCDLDQGWYGDACDQQGCITADGRICSGNGTCVLDKHGKPVCACPNEWGGGKHDDPNACGKRECKDCPVGVASCNWVHHWSELECLCICGHHCGGFWECECNDDNLVPPACSIKKCCEGFWGTCNQGMITLGIGGGGTCGDNSQCVCRDNYDPAQCCSAPLPGGATPTGYGQPCPGLSNRKMEIVCSGPVAACGACPAGNTQTADMVLTPTGNNGYTDQFGNTYKLDTSVCHVANVMLSGSSNGGKCGRPSDQGFWVRAMGSGWAAQSGLTCPTDCTNCVGVVGCSVTIH